MIERGISAAVLEALADTPIVFLGGARQTGKSTLVRWLARGKHLACYLSLDDLGTLAAARSDPVGFLAGFEGPLVIDEVQRAPELFLALKATVDRDRRAGRFLLTGSAQVLLLPRLSETLVGRMEVLTLWPLSQVEIEGRKTCFLDALFADRLPQHDSFGESRSALLQRLLRGGYPEVLSRSRPQRRNAWFSSYIETLLQREVRDLAQIDGLATLPRLLALVAARSSTLLNYSELSRSCAIPQTTLKRYLGLLQATFLVKLLPAWSGNLGKRLVKAPKAMVCDTGLMAYLLGMSAEQLRKHPDLLGRLLETFVVAELGKQLGWSRVAPTFFHYRTQTQREVDLLLEDRSGRVVGVEVKASSTVRSQDFRGLRSLAEDLGTRFHRGVLVHLGEEITPFGPHLHAVPLSALWRV